jgi:hypothetical protein
MQARERDALVTLLPQAQELELAFGKNEIVRRF